MVTLNKISVSTKKELADYFSSPAAILFLGIFAGVSLFAFFWIEAFFSRNIADVRPLFTWMPILLIFLIAAMTMRSWAEERRNGTIEIILTAPVSPYVQILGKYFAAIILVAIALLLTFSLPITVNVLGDLDWGPVIGGYIAAIFLASAYIAIGLWSSARTDNQIVSLILTVLIAGVLYAIGSQTITSFFDYQTTEVLRALGSGSRFESITRGVLDFRDILYYLTITVIFLFMNRISLEKLRWAGNSNNQIHNTWKKSALVVITTALFLNLAVNFTTKARIDLTDGQIYTLSTSTKQYLGELEKPLLIRGYFSDTTHPLLAPLIPQIRNLLTEYAVAGGNQVKVEFVDPHYNSKFEEEAGSKYGIKPVSFQTTSKYQAAVVNTYFDVLIKYNNQYDVLGYKDLVELKTSAGGHEVELNSPEYEISRTIQTVVAKSKRDIKNFKKLNQSFAITAYISSNEALPENYQNAKNLLNTAIEQLHNESNGNVDVIYIDPESDDITAEYLTNELNVRPHFSNLPNAEAYWFYVTISNGKKSVPISMPNNVTTDTWYESIISAMKRIMPNSINTVAFVNPSVSPGPAGIIASQFIPKKFNILRSELSESVRLVDLQLNEGKVPNEINFLFLLAPRYLDHTYKNAIQEFLARGGTVLIATSPLDASISDIADVQETESGLNLWFEKLGIRFNKELVLDKQHGMLPIPSPRRVGSFFVQEKNIVDYPYILDVRDKGFNEENVITSRLGQLYVPWANPIEIDPSKNKHREVTPLLMSSKESWVSNSKNILPDFESYPNLGFPRDTTNQGPRTLAVMIEGNFDDNAEISNDESNNPQGRLILVGSSSLFADNFSDLMTQSLQTEYRRPIQFAQNLIDWSIEDRGILNILRKHSHFTRTLETLSKDDKKYWEYLNYIFVILGLGIILSIVYLLRRQSGIRINQLLLQSTNEKSY